MSFTVISTFSGLGGSSLGYKLAGGKMLLACDFDDHAVATYKKNHPTTPVFHGDISDLSVDKIFEITGLKEGELDIFDGSPPCQGFSMTGKRKMDDNRNKLFLEYCRILKGLKPKCFIMENVSGMVKGNMKFIFVEILRTLKECGYKVKAKLLNAKYYQVAQSRERMIFIGVREDLNIDPTHPIGSKETISIRQCLKGCPDGERLICDDKFVNETLDKIKPGELFSKYHDKGHHFSSSMVDLDKPSRTICKTISSKRGLIFNPETKQVLSIEEIKRLSSFPDDYILEGKFEQKWARLGNCVPPNFMKAIAGHVYENIIKKVNHATST